ncbi:hypothetical protein OsJ_36880 [Oryza sativa Japonica Group]|uniref:Uncharacterized protein n=3 Tax=Oryza sativa subsp. japonica TaxID=39947 RepID=A3CJG4_ORYSJ|nr:hypothetical protein OsJ_36880 [Oryza sativa Japonica Group]
MALIAGSYERFIWGFSLKTLTSSSASASSSETLALAPLFSYPAHAGPIRCAAAAAPAGLAASGGSDDTVRLYDLPAAADLGPLLDPAAPVSALAIHSLGPVPRNLLAASDDGLLHLYDAGEGFPLLASLRVFPRHREPADALAVHPTGRVALAVGRSGGLAMLNLLRGRRSFSCRLEHPATAIAYAEDGAGGDRFVMAAEEKVTVHDSEDARIIHEIDCGKRVLAFAPAKKGILYTGGEERGITAWDLSSGKVTSRIEDAHSTRVKGIVVFDDKNDGSELCNLIASASSDGIIRIWDARMIAKEKTTPLAEANTKARLTCLAGSSLNFTRFLFIVYFFRNNCLLELRKAEMKRTWS